jgi:hypothetical protein
MLNKSKVESRKSKVFWGVTLLITHCLLPMVTNAQCAMCRASLESSGETQKAESLNDGIVYLMVIPYLLVGIVGVVIYRMYTKKRPE